MQAKAQLRQKPKKSFRGSATAAKLPSDNADQAVTNPTLGELRAELRAHNTEAIHFSAIAFAESLAAEAVRSWWNSLGAAHVTIRAAPSRPKVDLCDAARLAARQFGVTAAELPIAEAAYHLSLLYTSLLPAEWRGRHGIHYTPPLLAERLLDQVTVAGLDWSKITLLDPAAGAGAFLIPAVQRILPTLADCQPAFALHLISSRVRGFELDSFAAWLGQVFLEAVTLPLTIESGGRRLKDIIEVCDSLNKEIKAPRFDLVIGNPPFGRQKLPTDQRERFERSLFGHANLYGIFMDLAVQHARKDGFIAFLTPSSFLAGEYFKNLRSLLWNEAPPVALDFVTARKGVFEDVLQETVLATYRRGASRQPAKVSFIQASVGRQIKPEVAGFLTLPRTATAPWLLPRHADEASLVKRMRAMSCRLSDWGYTVSTGPLVWNRFKDQLHDKDGQGRIPLVWAESVTSDGRFVFRSEKRNHKPYFALQPNDEWLVVKQPCVLLQRTTAKEQARRLIAAEMPATFINKHGSVTVENHLNMLLPINNRPSVSPALLATFLNSTAADRAFRCLSGSVAVSAYELENLPLPNATELKRLIGRYSDREAVEAAAAKLYSAKEG